MPGAQREVSNTMPNGTRRVTDIEAPDSAGGIEGNEVKVGRTTRTGPIRQEAGNDETLLGTKYSKITWHFYRSPFTGRIGPSAALAQALLDAGITIVLHF